MPVLAAVDYTILEQISTVICLYKQFFTLKLQGTQLWIGGPVDPVRVLDNNLLLVQDIFSTQRFISQASDIFDLAK